ncbi:rubrerythrin-like domain-containing protein [Haloglomus halophilum]|nr:rubrerythrin-like domain-containing protein [Haloglomus halophilum]
MRDVEYESGEESAYECFDCGNITLAELKPSTCPDCGGQMRNRRMPLE